MLFNEPKLLKSSHTAAYRPLPRRFSALQRAEIAEIEALLAALDDWGGFSALQRAEIAEMLEQIAVGALRQMFQCSSTSRNC